MNQMYRKAGNKIAERLGEKTNPPQQQNNNKHQLSAKFGFVENSLNRNKNFNVRFRIVLWALCIDVKGYKLFFDNHSIISSMLAVTFQ